MTRDGRARTPRRRGQEEKKVKVSITVSPRLLAWIDSRMGPGKAFGSISHAFESGIVNMMDVRDRAEFE